MVVAPKRHGARESGFSIVELMTTIAILALLLGFAIPSFQEFIV
ncbi:MAG: prepilin-type N-terminal cleavage/methylation domain-containing protein, partial [Xanthomonadales bacterium]|nr:prepilin-type N-terminal cleavage/methylation domain-containing protein [Xanthomonadales bacterium]